jgi:hypothetical protein
MTRSQNMIQLLRRRAAEVRASAVLVESAPELTVKALIEETDPERQGQLILAVAVPWFEIAELIRKDPQAIYSIDPGFLAACLLLAACGADQQAPTAPSTTPNFFRAKKTETFNVSCTSAGTSTSWHVTIALNSLSASYDIPCGGTQVVTMTSYGYLAHVFNLSNGEVVQCQNTRPIKGPKSITCSDAARSGASSTLSVTVN